MGLENFDLEKFKNILLEIDEIRVSESYDYKEAKRLIKKARKMLRPLSVEDQREVFHKANGLSLLLLEWELNIDEDHGVS